MERTGARPDPMRRDRSIWMRWIINALALMVVAWLFGGVHVSGLLSLLIAAAVLGWVNAYIRPFVVLLTLPLNLVTLGLFTFVVNALMLILTSALVPGFAVRGFWTAVGASLVLAVVSGVLSWAVRKA